jgi:rare lipoprotein A
MGRSFDLTAALVLLVAAACAAPGQHNPVNSPVSDGRNIVTAPSSMSSVATSSTGSLQTPGYRATGLASWYGGAFQGRRTASGEIFDMNLLTAAHRTLPLGTLLLVTDSENGRSVTVTVNDRGPFIAGRIIDLSYAAARQLGIVSQGVADVRIESVGPVVPTEGLFSVQAAIYVEEDNAQTLKERLSRRFGTVKVLPFETNIGRFYRVRVGAYGSEEKAERIAGKLVREGLEPIVLRID